MTITMPSGWFHMTMVYKGSPFGITVYHDARSVTGGLSDWSTNHPNNPSDVVIGYYFESGTNKKYASVMVDELLFWDEELDPSHITMLYNSYN